MRKEERLGEARVMNCGEIAFIVEYVGYNNITVQFKTTGELVKTTYQNFKNCNVKCNVITKESSNPVMNEINHRIFIQVF